MAVNHGVPQGAQKFLGGGVYARAGFRCWCFSAMAIGVNVGPVVPQGAGELFVACREVGWAGPLCNSRRPRRGLGCVVLRLSAACEVAISPPRAVDCVFNIWRWCGVVWRGVEFGRSEAPPRRRTRELYDSGPGSAGDRGVQNARQRNSCTYRGGIRSN